MLKASTPLCRHPIAFASFFLTLHLFVLQQVDTALDGLSTVLREAVVLRYLRGLSEKEAAVHAGCPVSAMKWRASDGIAKLRQRLATSQEREVLWLSSNTVAVIGTKAEIDAMKQRVGGEAATVEKDPRRADASRRKAPRLWMCRALAVGRPIRTLAVPATRSWPSPGRRLQNRKDASSTSRSRPAVCESRFRGSS